jgi:hypothetical protein
MLHRKPCAICHHWFTPNVHVGTRQRVCSAPACQEERQQRNRVSWRGRHRDDAVKRRMVARRRRAAKGEAVDPLPMPAPLADLPWDMAQEEFRVQGADFLAHLGRVLLRATKEESRVQAVESMKQSGGVPPGAAGEECAVQAP